MTGIGSFFSIGKAPPQNSLFCGGALVCQNHLAVARLFRAHGDSGHLQDIIWSCACPTEIQSKIRLC